MSTSNQPKESFSIISAEEKVRKARTWLLLNKPFWGTLLMKLKVRVAPHQKRTRSMITDGRSIEFNPLFVDGLSFEETTAVLAHEVGHCALKHVFRMGGREHKAWEEACDHVINLSLLRDGFTLPQVEGHDPYRDPQFEGMSAEQVYPIVLARRQQQQDQQDQQQQSQSQCQGQSMPVAASEAEESDEDEEPDSMGEMAAPGTLDDEADDEQPQDEPQPDDEAEEQAEREAQQDAQSEADAEGEQQARPDPSDAEGAEDAEQDEGSLSEADSRALEEEWGQAAAAAAQQALSRGHGSAQQQRTVLASNKPPIPFDEYLRFFIMRCLDRCDQSWQRQSRRTIVSGPYLPATRGERLGRLGIVIDTSGSITEKALGKFFEQVVAVQADLRPAEIVLLFADDAVANEVRFSEHEPFEVSKEQCRGGGGTDFRPAFVRFNEIREAEGVEFAGIIYLTDLEGDFPTAAEAQAGDYPPTLWVFDSNRCWSAQAKKNVTDEVTFGEVVEIV